ncbi:hypothetical protein NL676_013924 [Syzygium grande]|nr:hypothetical protein NL676_013924 [Syzygium grande]
MQSKPQKWLKSCPKKGTDSKIRSEYNRIRGMSSKAHLGQMMAIDDHGRPARCGKDLLKELESSFIYGIDFEVLRDGTPSNLKGQLLMSLKSWIATF